MKPYTDYNSYLRSKYGCKIYRIALDAGFTCPNRDGTKSTGGCIYCNDSGSRAPYVDPKISLSLQISSRIRHLKDKRGAEKFIAYFQAFTNTYAPIDKLKAAYDAVLPFEEIVGISIGTRPDSIDAGKLKLISSYRDRYEVWMEYGLQSSHDRTLDLLKRGHTFQEFADAVKLTQKSGILISAHVIIGLPGETGKDILETAARLNELKVDGVKIHPLHVLKGSALEKTYQDKKINMLGQDEYAGLVCDFLENLSEDIIIQRLTGQGTAVDHIAPVWALNKSETIKSIMEMFEKRGSRQGSKIAVKAKS